MPNQVITLLVLTYLAMLALLLKVASTPALFRYYTLCKGITSTSFVVIACCCSSRLPGFPGGGPYPVWPLIVALLLAAGGDIAIGLANNRHGAANASHSKSGMIGVGFFMVAHIFYLLWFSFFIPGVHPAMFILPVIALFVMRYITHSPHFHFSCVTRIAATVYYIVVSLMFSVGIYAAVSIGNPARRLLYSSFRAFFPNSVLLATGVTCFLFSDALMLLLYFYTRRRCPAWVRPVNLFTYYLAQLLLALSILL